jgi:parvulin-like peptidyl-prolyl isomerase
MKVISGSVRSRVRVSEDEIQELFDRRYGSLEPGMRVRTRHILFAWPEEDTPEARAQLLRGAREIRQHAIETGDFAGFARKYSALRSAAQGGLTVMREGDVSPEIAAQVFALERGAISEPIETAHGVNLFQMLDRFDPSEVKLEDVHDALYAELVERKTIPEFERWIQEVRKTRYIGIVVPELQ